MADQVMTVVGVTKAGILDCSLNANAKAGNAAGTDDFLFPNDGQTILYIDGTTGDTWTFTAVADKYGRTETLTVTVAAGKYALVGPFLPELWNDAAGRVTFKPAAGGNVADKLLAVRVANPT